MPRDIDYFQQQFEDNVFEDEEPIEAAPAVSDEQIKAFVDANIGNPALIAETAAQYGVSVADLSRATGYDTNVVVDYLKQAEAAPPVNYDKIVEDAYASIGRTGVGEGANQIDEAGLAGWTEALNSGQIKPEDFNNRFQTAVTDYIAQNPDDKYTQYVNDYRAKSDTPKKTDETSVKEGTRETEGPTTKTIYEPKLVDLGDGTFRTPGGNIIDKDGYPVTKAVDTTTTTASETTPAATTAATTTTLPAITDYQGNQYDGAQVLTLARQISQNAGTMTGGAFQTKGQSIGFDASEAEKLLGRPPTASEQVLLDMARQMIQSGVTDLSQLKTQDITSSGVTVHIDPETNQYYALVTNPDGETSTRKDLTDDQVAKIRTEEIIGSGDEGTYVRRTIDDLVTGKGLFANGKMLSQADAVDNPIAYTIGATYTGGGGTSYDLKFDPKTGKSVISANGFSTSDADMLMPLIMIASNFLLPGASSFLSSTLLEAGMGELTSQIVSKSIINGVTSGIMAEASGGDFGDGFLKGAVTGAVSAGVAPVIQTALPSDLSPAMSTALTKAGTAAITALATGTDVGTAIGTQLLNSAVNTGLGSVTEGVGISTADAKLLNSVLTPVVTQLVTNGNVSDATLMNAVLLAGSTVLANIDSSAVNNVSTLTTGSDTDKVVGGLNLLANESGDETINNIASTVNTGLGALSTATGLLNKATSLTNTPKTRINKTRANLTGALRTNTPTTRTAAVKPAALGALNTAKKTLSSQQMSQLKASKPPARVNVANLTPIKKPPQRVDVKTLIPVKKAQLPAGLNTKKMG
jgi:chemotaxis protein CheY-P-specific phosphatase CheC